MNSAAYTAVDQAESEPELAMAITGKAPGVLAEEASRLGAPMVHFSTDYVFDGTANTPYRECDQPNPLNVYGESKFRGEQAVRERLEQHLVLRTSWVYARRGKNFLTTMTRLFREKDEITIVDDQTGAPTWARMIAETTAMMLARTGEDETRQVNNERWGLYHLSAADQTSWHGFAMKIRELIAPDTNVRLLAIATKNYPTAARRPAFSVLDNSRLNTEWGLNMPSWETGLELSAHSAGLRTDDTPYPVVAFPCI